MTRLALILILLPAAVCLAAPTSLSASPPTELDDVHDGDSAAGTAASTAPVSVSPRTTPEGPAVPVVHLVSCDADGAVLSVEFPEARLVERLVEGRTYTEVVVPGAPAVSPEGEPLLPLFNTRLWVPPGSELRVSATGSDAYGRTVDNPLPAPELKIVEVNGLERIEEHYAAKARTVAVERPRAALTRTEIVRGWRLAHLELRPVALEGSSLRGYRRLRVEVAFGPAPVDTPLARELGDHPDQLDLAASLAPNFATARELGWRLQRTAEPPAPFGVDDLPGQLYKVVVVEDGPYVLTRESLAAAGVDVDALDPRRMGLYTSSGRMLDADDLFDRDPLYPVPVEVTGAADGTFDEGDALYFWGRGSFHWEVPDAPPTESAVTAPSVTGVFADQPGVRNHYSDYGYYWLVLDEDEPLRFADLDAAPAGEPELDHLQGRLHHEDDVESLNRSKYTSEGMDFYWDRTVPEPTGWTFDINLVDYTPADTTYMAYGVHGNAKYFDCEFQVYYDEDVTPERLVDSFPLDDDDRTVSRWFTVPAEYPTSGKNELTLYVDDGGDEDLNQVSIDSLEVLYPRGLEARNGAFEAWGGFEQSGRRRLTVTGLTSDDIAVWDLTAGARLTNYELEGPSGLREVVFAWDVEPDRHLIVFDRQRAREPLDIYPDAPGELDEPVAADLIYVTHPALAAALDPLADYHRSRGLRVEVVNVDDIYDAYAGGRMDPVAIRNYLKHAFADPLGDPLSYACLVGDGSYDYRDSEGIYNGPLWRDFGENLLPPHYVHYSTSFVPSDNFFAALNAGTTEPQIALTRLSVVDEAELERIVERCLGYPEVPAGRWQVRNILVADNYVKYSNPDDGRDETGNFDRYAEEICNYYSSFSIEPTKLYMTQMGVARTGEEFYCQYSLGARRNAVRELITRAVLDDTGSLFYNYFGHGGWHTWADELTLTERPPLYLDREAWAKPQPAVLVQSSCSVADFDRSKNTNEYPESIAEYLMRTRDGLLAGVGSTRVTGGGTCQSYHAAFYNAVYHPEAHLDTPRLGLLHQSALLTSGNIALRSKWAFLGDPATELRRPVGGITLYDPGLTSVARGEVIEITGRIADASLGVETVEVVAYDRPMMPYSFTETPVRLVRPVTRAVGAVDGNAFTVELPVPWTIDNDLNPEPIPDDALYTLEIHAYAPAADGRRLVVDEPWNFGDSPTQRDFSRATPWLDTEILIEGAVEPPADNGGPQIDFTLNGGSTASGDLVSGEFELELTLNDPHGILTVRDDAGMPGPAGDIDRPIVLTADAEGHSLQFDLTEDYATAADDYTRGVVSRSIELPPGRYTLTALAYDRFGEPGTASFELRVEDEMTLEQVLVVPNPAPGPTAFTFVTSRRPDRARIRIYTPAGRLVRTIDDIIPVAGFNVVEWDGDDDGGRPLANGVYLYQLEVGLDETVCETYEKFIMLR